MVLTRAAAASKSKIGAPQDAAAHATATRSKAPTTKSQPPALQNTGQHPPKTADGHYIVVHGRRWRATDPLLPADVEAELKKLLGRARSALRGKGGSGNEDVVLIRKRVGLAKLGLGERGQPVWWEDSEAGRRSRWEDALAALRNMEANTVDASEKSPMSPSS